MILSKQVTFFIIQELLILLTLSVEPDKHSPKVQFSTLFHHGDFKLLSVFFSFYSALIDLQYNATQGIDFLIRGGRIGNSNFLGISLLLLQDRRWERVKVSFLVNSRKDVWLGSFTYSIFLFI